MSLSRWKDVWRRTSGRGVYPHELAWLLLFPLRGVLLSPATLIRALDLKPTSRVLELGPGPGYFSVAAARAVPRGRLDLVDLQREMVEKARRRLRSAGVSNASYSQANAACLPFRPKSFDAAFLVAVLGEVTDAYACLQSVAGVLRPGATLAISELPGDPDALSEAEVHRLATSAGLEFLSSVRRFGGFVARFRAP